MASMLTVKAILAGQVVAVPVIKDRFGRHVTPACDFLRQLVERNPRGASSAKTYAEQLVSFLTFLEKERIALDDFSDGQLSDWMAERATRGLTRSFIEGGLDTVFRFAVWLAKKGHDDIVRLPSSTYPPGYVFRLSAKRDTSRRRRAIEGIVSGLSAPGKDSDLQVTPTSAHVAKLAVVIASQPMDESRERNETFISWYHDVGLRRTECVRLPVSQIPTFEQIAKMTIQTEYQEVVLENTKGGRRRWVAVLPSLLERTREYIEGPRRRVVERFASSYGPRGEPNEVFLSTKTGLALHPGAVSNLFTGLFSKAGIGGHGHRIRATFLTNLFEEEYKAQLALRNSLGSPYQSQVDFEHILRKVAEKAGHLDPESLRHYVVILRKRHARESGADEAVALAQLIASRKVELATLEHRVALLKGELPS